MANTFINQSQLKSQSPSNHARQLGDRMDNFKGPAEFPLTLGDWVSANPYPCHFVWLLWQYFELGNM